MERVYVEQMLEKQTGDMLTVTQAYVHFSEFVKRRNMPALKRRDFKQMLAELVREHFDLGLRNDLRDETDKKHKTGWKNLKLVPFEGEAEIAAGSD